MDPAYVLYFDGGSRGNPGIAGCGAALCKKVGATEEWIWSGAKYLHTQTNNVAEYNGLIMGLEAAADLELAPLHIKGDSKLVLNQVPSTCTRMSMGQLTDSRAGIERMALRKGAPAASLQARAGACDGH